MRQVKRIALATIVFLAAGLVGWPLSVVADESAHASSGAVASMQAQGKGPVKGDKGNDKAQDDKGNGNNGNNGNGNNGNNRNGNNGVGNGNQVNNGNGAASSNGSVNAPGRGPGFGAWWRSFRARLFGESAADDFGGWQLGRFKDAFPFAYPPGWQVSARGDALVVTGPWQDGDFVFQLTRTVQLDYATLNEWVRADLDRVGVDESNARYAQAGRAQVAVLTGADDPNYECPVAYVYLWTQNPAGHNQRQALGVIAQAPGETCDSAALSAFVDAYLDRISEGAQPLPLVTPTAPATPAATATPMPSPTATARPAGAGWQQTRFFNAFSFAYPTGWTMDRLGDTAHLQGSYAGRAYVMDIVWVRTTPQSGLEAWVRADLADLGALEGAAINYLQQGGAQFAIVSHARLAGYDCPVVRIYVLADNPAGDGPRAYAGTVAQVNGQTCDSTALEGLVSQMLQQF